jgi:hypothetical protein
VKNATILTHFLAHLTNILSEEEKRWRKRRMMGGKREAYDVTPSYVAERCRSRLMASWQVIWQTVYLIRQMTIWACAG